MSIYFTWVYGNYNKYMLLHNLLIALSTNLIMFLDNH